jgi:hypothetical protein
LAHLTSEARRLFYFVLATSVLVSLGFAFAVSRNSQRLEQTVGLVALPSAQSLLRGNGLTFCTSELVASPGNTICFHSARMPIVPAVIALGLKLFGDRLLAVTLFKTLLLLIPIELAVWIVCLNTPQAREHMIITGILLLIPFLNLIFLGDVIGLEYEEFYSYSLIALGSALAFWNKSLAEKKVDHLPLAGLVGACAAAVYLCKSSMLLTAAVLLIAGLQYVTGYRARLLAVALALAAPAGWMLYQHHAGGRATLGTSIDGFNLHMGNSPNFLRDYPPPPGGTLDLTASQLHAGHIFPDEWSMNDFHQHAATVFIRTHPAATMEGFRRKVGVVLFSTRVVGRGARQGLMNVIGTAGSLVFRFLFWTSCLLSVFFLATNCAALRSAGAVFLLLISAVALPYMIGFAYTRHISVLMYPTVLLCCLTAQRWLALRRP